MGSSIYKIPKTLALIIFLFDCLAITLALGIANYLIPLLIFDNFFAQNQETLNYFVLFTILILATFFCRGHYKNRIPYWQQIKTISKTFLITTGITLLVYIIFQINIFLPLIIITWITALIFISVGRSIAFKILKRSKSWYLPVTILGDNQMIIDCMYAFYNDGQTGFLVNTIMLRDRIKKPICLDFIPNDHPKIKLIDASDDYLEYIEMHKENFYIIDLEGLRGENRDNLISLLEQNKIDYAIAPPTKRLHLYGMKPLYFFGSDVMLLNRHEKQEQLINRSLKRGLDICVSTLLLPFLVLFTLFVFLNKKMNNSKTPIFYGGLRLGKNGKQFPCWKFNTMKMHADQILLELLNRDLAAKEEWNKFQKLKNDPRIDSKFSSLLRKTSLDELPQIWNVFKGDMSLVGARPILPQQCEEYGEFLHLYTAMKPGITGLWQVSGRNETTFEQRIYWDGWYVKNWSLWHDFVILLKTVSVLLTKKGAN